MEGESNKSKINSFIKGFLSAFDLSGGVEYYDEKVFSSDLESINNYWRKVGDDIGFAANKVSFEYESEDLKELRERLEEWSNERHKNSLRNKNVNIKVEVGETNREDIEEAIKISMRVMNRKMSEVEEKLSNPNDELISAG